MAEQNTAEINLLDMFRMIGAHWRWIIAGLVVGGCLLGAYKFAKDYRSMTDPATIAARQEDFESDMEAYERKREQLETRIENLTNEVELQESFLENDILFRIDPYNVYLANAAYYVDTGYEIRPELSYQNADLTSRVVNSYRNTVSRLDLSSILSRGSGERILIDNPVTDNTFSVLSVWTEASNGILFVTVNADTRENAELIMEAIDDSIATAREEFTEIYGEHEITRMQYGIRQKIDLELLSLRDSFDADVETTTNALTKATESLENLTEPVLEDSGWSPLIRGTVKYGLLGLVLGAVAVAAWEAIRFVVLCRLWSPCEIPRQYHIPSAGTFPAGKVRR